MRSQESEPLPPLHLPWPGLLGFICPTREAKTELGLKSQLSFWTFANVNNIIPPSIFFVSVFFSRVPVCFRCFGSTRYCQERGLVWHAWFGGEIRLCFTRHVTRHSLSLSCCKHSLVSRFLSCRVSHLLSVVCLLSLVCPVLFLPCFCPPSVLSCFCLSSVCPSARPSVSVCVYLCLSLVCPSSPCVFVVINA